MKKSILTKSIYLLLTASFFVVLLFAVLEVYTIHNFNSQIEEVYINSVNYSSNYWANQFYIINKELKEMVNKDGNTAYNMLKDTEDPGIRREKTEELQSALTNMSVLNGKQFVFFIYFPDENMLRFSVSYIDYIQEEGIGQLKEYIQKEYVQRENSGNTAEWKAVELEGTEYFIHVYEHRGGYSGCFITCENVLRDITPDTEGGTAYMQNMDGTLFYGNKGELRHINFTYSRAIQMINKKICVEFPYVFFINSSAYIFAIILIAMAAAVAMTMIALIYHKRTVINPITKLENAMIEFSSGNTEVRMEHYTDNNEIRVLYETFNRMAEQIMHLKINIYESDLEKRKIYNQFLRIQIQPHFYTNILNLIYMLAGAQDYKTIQDLARYMVGYFRYLLSLKGDYVILEDELQCVRHYAKVQSIRYEDGFVLHIHCEPGMEREKIPALLIQTFVENSIRHNVMVVPKLEIDLVIAEENEGISIRVSDNGCGFPEEILTQIEEKSLQEEEGNHIGISNVMKRLQILYRGKAFLKIENREQGARVSIWIPYYEESSSGELDESVSE